MTRITFRMRGVSPHLGADECAIWEKRLRWLDRRAGELRCFVDTAWDRLLGYEDEWQLTLLIPGTRSPWVGDPQPELVEWITELGFEIVETSNAS